MKVQILYGFRGRETKEVYLPKGEHELDDKLALYLISVGHATALDQIAVMPDLGEIASKVDPLHKATLEELRVAYHTKTGKKAYHAWDAATLEQKLAAWDSDHA